MAAQTRMFLPKPKSGATSIDADGKIVHVEVREDEEQVAKLDEIIGILVSAGYYRARITGLSSFDKVVGGLVWCIENCTFDVDVDLLFQENLTIGQRIPLTEKIVAVLPAMGCPHRIEPHQIQGLDCIHIFPVIQWLVKRSQETRQEFGAQIRALSVSQFARLFPRSVGKSVESQKTIDHINTIKDAYGPVRRFKRRDMTPLDKDSRAKSALLEYGHVPTQAFVPQYTKDEDDEFSEDEGLTKEEQEAEEEKLATLMQSMDIAPKSEDSRVAAAIAGSMVGDRASEIAQAAGEHAGSGSQGSPGEGSVARRIAALERRRTALSAEVARLEQHTERLNSELGSAQQRLAETRQAQTELRDSLGALADIESEPHKGAARQLLALLTLHEGLTRQESQFKQHCRAERDRLQSLVDGAGLDPGPEKSLTPQLEREREQLGKLRVQLGRRNRAIAGLQRQLDEMPGRAELAQYQRRFLELYTQVSGKHRETKQYYTLYNTLHDTQLYLNKELTLLNSIQDNYAQAMSSSSSKEQFLAQFDAIVKGIKENKNKVCARRDEERARRDRLSRTLLGLVEQQRSYVAMVTQLTAECRHNEALLAQLRAVSEPRQQQ